MIHKDAQSRPFARCISAHPVFWNNQKILAFLQDVSDRVEKLQFHVEPLKSLEKNGRCIVREDWNAHVDPLITEDLRKYRGYMGASVRDLLRALRNKVSSIIFSSNAFDYNCICIFWFARNTITTNWRRKCSRSSAAYQTISQTIGLINFLS